jgi:hypothetical protein
MASRITTCPLCKSQHIRVVKIHNPNTKDMNSNATLRCEDCNHEWEGHVASAYHKEQRRRGFSI